MFVLGSWWCACMHENCLLVLVSLLTISMLCFAAMILSILFPRSATHLGFSLSSTTVFQVCLGMNVLKACYVFFHFVDHSGYS